MTRRFNHVRAVIANGAALSGAVDFRLVVMGVLHMPAAWTAADVAFKVSPTEDGTYLPLFDHDDAIVRIDGAVASQAYELPPELAGAGWIKLWSEDDAEGDENQGAERVLLLTLKS